MRGRGLGRCPLCGSPVQPGTTIFAADLGSGVVVLRDVPAYVCQLCGNAAVADGVAATLEGASAAARKRNSLVSVTGWYEVEPVDEEINRW